MRRSQVRRAVKKQETPFQGKPCEHERLKQVVQKHLFGTEDQGISVQSQKQIGGESLLLEHHQKKVHRGERAEITAEEKVQQILEIAYTGRKVSVQKGIRAA